MIKMTYEAFMGQGFTRVIQKVTSIPLTTQAAYRVKKIADKMQAARAQIQSEYLKEIEPFAKKDEAGEFVRPDNNPEAFDIPDEKKDAFLAMQKAFGERMISIDRPKLVIQDLGDHKFSAAELSVLEPMVNFGEDSPSTLAEVHSLPSA